jgi:hypothetical protein
VALINPQDLEKNVLFLAKVLAGQQYAFRGTTSLVLQGIKMNVDDIDILTDKPTALACNQLLADFISEEVAYKESPQFKSFFGKFQVNGILVEVMGEWQIKDKKGDWGQVFKAVEEEKKEIKLQEQKIWVTTIPTELVMFAQMNRWPAYHKIKKQAESLVQPKLF